jgi:hypothetical protein
LSLATSKYVCHQIGTVLAGGGLFVDLPGERATAVIADRAVNALVIEPYCVGLIRGTVTDYRSIADCPAIDR